MILELRKQIMCGHCGDITRKSSLCTGGEILYHKVSVICSYVEERMY